jgi:hypothetical protein
MPNELRLFAAREPRQKAVLNSIRAFGVQLLEFQSRFGEVSNDEMGPSPVMARVEPAQESRAGAG